MIGNLSHSLCPRREVHPFCPPAQKFSRSLTAEVHIIVRIWCEGSFSVRRCRWVSGESVRVAKPQESLRTTCSTN